MTHPLLGEPLLKHVAHLAQHKFKCVVWQWLPGYVGSHAPGSLHYQKFSDGVGRAFDAYGRRMGIFAWWVGKYHGKHLTEGIYNGRLIKLSIKNGQHVPSSYWGPVTWAEHANHVHVGI